MKKAIDLNSIKGWNYPRYANSSAKKHCYDENSSLCKSHEGKISPNHWHSAPLLHDCCKRCTKKLAKLFAQFEKESVK